MYFANNIAPVTTSSFQSTSARANPPSWFVSSTICRLSIAFTCLRFFWTAGQVNLWVGFQNWTGKHTLCDSSSFPIVLSYPPPLPHPHIPILTILPIMKRLATLLKNFLYINSDIYGTCRLLLVEAIPKVKIILSRRVMRGMQNLAKVRRVKEEEQWLLKGEHRRKVRFLCQQLLLPTQTSYIVVWGSIIRNHTLIQVMLCFTRKR